MTSAPASLLAPTLASPIFVVTDDGGQGDHGILFAGTNLSHAFETAMERAVCNFGEVELKRGTADGASVGKVYRW